MATPAKDWNATLYLKFESERTRPSRDLLSHVPLASPRRVVDLGCGPGNSTAVLAERYPHAHVTGMDSSPEMIAKARNNLPHIEFTVADLLSYEPAERVDLFFSNAVLQWLSAADRLSVVTRLMRAQPSGSVFAFQIPDNLMEPSHAAMRETAADGPWAAKLGGLQITRDPIQSAEVLYDEVKPLCSSVDMWHTHYHHVLENQEAIVEWVKSTGLRPFIDPLSAEEKEAFLKSYLERVKKAYPPLHDGKVLLRFPRLFVVAVRA